MFIFCPNRVIQRADFCKIWAGIEISLFKERWKMGERLLREGEKGGDIHTYTHIHTLIYP